MQLAPMKNRAYRRSMGRVIHPVLGAAAAVLAGGLAVVQPPRLIPPVDQYGIALGPATPLDMPADPQPGWVFEPSERLFELQMEGALVSSGADAVRIRREGEPDALVQVQPDTTFYLGGEPATRDQLPEGAEVRVVFDLEGNRRIARRIEAPAGGEALQPTGPPPVSSELPGEPGAG